MLYKSKGGHEIVLESWNDTSMDWEVNKRKGKYRHYIDNEVLGLASISFCVGDGIHHTEAINIVIEKNKKQLFIKEITNNQESHCEDVG